MIKGYYKTSEEVADDFVGLRFIEGTPEVVFPHGYALPDDETECRKDVFRLLSVLKRFANGSDGEKVTDSSELITSLPLTSYQYVIMDFLSNGYYIEKETRYVESLKGKINWKRTIQKEQPQLDNGNVVYLNFQVKTNQINNNSLLTRIHEYCVYQSFARFGWLYISSAYLPQKPQIKLEKKLFVSVLKEAIGNTFNDAKRRLFSSMINIIEFEDDKTDLRNSAIGVNRFEHAWENLIDHVFGENDKDKYFPHAKWHIIKTGEYKKTSPLQPDTIMKKDGKIYILDAKYYRYGLTGNPDHLPGTDSIQKQITYGKHIAEKMGEVSADNVYNAFVMPFDAAGGDRLQFVSIGTADWESCDSNTHNYAYVLGILLDTKWLMTNYVRHYDSEIEKLAELIEKSLKEYKATNKVY